METNIVYGGFYRDNRKGSIGIIEKKMETTVIYRH